MTNKHDGPRPGSEVTVVQSATPTRLTQAEAEELDTLIQAVLKTRLNLGLTQAEHRFDSQECSAAQDSDDQAYIALYRWQRAHGLESK